LTSPNAPQKTRTPRTPACASRGRPGRPPRSLTPRSRCRGTHACHAAAAIGLAKARRHRGCRPLRSSVGNKLKNCLYRPGARRDDVDLRLIVGGDIPLRPRLAIRSSRRLSGDRPRACAPTVEETLVVNDRGNPHARPLLEWNCHPFRTTYLGTCCSPSWLMACGSEERPCAIRARIDRLTSAQRVLRIGRGTSTAAVRGSVLRRDGSPSTACRSTICSYSSSINDELPVPRCISGKPVPGIVKSRMSFPRCPSSPLARRPCPSLLGVLPFRARFCVYTALRLVADGVTHENDAVNAVVRFARNHLNVTEPVTVQKLFVKMYPRTVVDPVASRGPRAGRRRPDLCPRLLPASSVHQRTRIWCWPPTSSL